MSSPYRLLMVEDSADDEELLLRVLKSAGLNFTARRVEIETDYLAAIQTDRPDIILCDYHLPRFSAKRALELLAANHFDLPFIVVSNHIGEDAAVQAMQNGASDYLIKNRLARLPNAIESAIEQHRIRQQQAVIKQQLSDSESMKHSILNSLSTRIAVLDENGLVQAVNQTWENFAQARKQQHGIVSGVGENYFDTLHAALDLGDHSAADAIEGLQAVIKRERLFFSMEYQLLVGNQYRWFVMRAMPLAGSANGAVVSHEDISDRMLTHTALENANKRLKLVSKRVISIQEDERRAISRELHDDIGQSLAALKMVIYRLMKQPNQEASPLLENCLAITDTTIDKLRRLSHDLRPPQLDQLGLEDAIHWLVESISSATGIKIDCTISGLDKRLSTEMESACYRIVQEALNNASRHAKPTLITVTIKATPNLINLTVRDDGKGFDAEAERVRAMKSGSMGLISMDERAELAGGRVKVRTDVGKGTSIQATFPLKNEASIPAPDSLVDA